MSTFINIRFFAILLSFFLLFISIYAVAKKKLLEEFSFLWVFAALCLLIFTVFTNFLEWITKALNVSFLGYTLLFLGMTFLIFVIFHLSIIISELKIKTKKLAQEIALLSKQ
ncbi:MAG: DUF2304 domain-containing protein [Pseudomonadota bacterium]